MPGHRRSLVFRSALVLVILSSAAGLLFARGEGEREWKAADVCFREEITGATGQGVFFTPVRCSAPNEALGPTVSTPYAGLRFRDLSGDGRSEAIVESPAFRCRNTRVCYTPHRYVLSLEPNKSPPVRVLSKTYLPDLDYDNAYRP